MKNLVIILTVISLCACGKVYSEQAELRLNDVPSEGVYGMWTMIRLNEIKLFKSQNPDIKLIPATGLKLEGDLSESNFLMSIAGEIAPDVFERVSLRMLKGYVDQKFLMPLDDFIEKEHIEMPGLIKKAATINGHVYGIPYYDYLHCLMYRSDLLIEAGLVDEKGRPKPPRNWDELYEYSKKLTKVENGKIVRYGFGVIKGGAAGWYWTNFVWQAGGDMVRQGKDGKWVAIYNSPEAVQAGEFYKKLMWAEWERDGEKYTGVAKACEGTTEGVIADFTQGKIAMTMVFLLESLNPDFLFKYGVDERQVGFSSLPEGPKGRANMLGCDLVCINNNIKNKQELGAALRFLKYITGKDARASKTRIYVEHGYGKWMRPSYLRDAGYGDIVKKMSPSWVDTVDNIYKYARIEPNCPGYQNVQSLELAVPIEKIILNRDTDVKKALDASVENVNRLVFGSLPEKIVKFRARVVTFAFIIILLISGFLMIRTLLKLSMEFSAANPAATKNMKSKNRLIAWIFMIPALLTVLIWQYYPLLKGTVIAFQDYKILGTKTFVGLSNFVEVLWAPLFHKSLVITIVYVSLSLLIGFFIPIVLAILLTEVPRGKTLFRTIFYLPTVTSGLIILFLWKKVLYDSSATGLLNIILGWVGIPPQDWLGNPNLAMLSVILPGIWAGAGPGCLIYIAALKTVGEEIYEAADIDGAGIWVKIWHITLPTIKPLIIINFVGAFIGSFHAMQNVLVMTSGGPANATHTLGIHIFTYAFLFLKFGYATAAAWILGSLLIGFTVYQLRILKRMEFGTAK